MGGVADFLTGSGGRSQGQIEAEAQQAKMLQDQQNELAKQKKKAEEQRMDSLTTRLAGGSIFDTYGQNKNNGTLG